MTMIHVRTIVLSTYCFFFFFFQAEDGIRDTSVTGVQTCALPICIDCRFDSRDFAPGRAGANPAPRGVGARGWRRICSPDLFLSPTPPEPTSVPAGFVFSKTESWDQLPSLSPESKREDATARFLRRGFPYGFSRGI